MKMLFYIKVILLICLQASAGESGTVIEPETIVVQQDVIVDIPELVRPIISKWCLLREGRYLDLETYFIISSPTNTAVQVVANNNNYIQSGLFNYETVDNRIDHIYPQSRFNDFKLFYDFDLDSLQNFKNEERNKRAKRGLMIFKRCL